MQQDENKEQDAKPHVHPSEPKDERDETGNQAGDPGRTPGKAEGEDTDDEDAADEG